MSMTTNRATESANRVKLKNLAKMIAETDGVGPSVCEAAQDLLVAIEYRDTVLEAASSTALMTAISELVQDCINQAIAAPEELEKLIEEILDSIKEGCCYEENEIDFLKSNWKQVVQCTDHNLRQLTGMQRTAIKLQAVGHNFRGMTELQFRIDAAKTTREKVLNAWPKPIQETPPLDKEMVARSRAADSRGDVKSIGDLINCL